MKLHFLYPIDWPRLLKLTDYFVKILNFFQNKIYLFPILPEILRLFQHFFVHFIFGYRRIFVFG